MSNLSAVTKPGKAGCKMFPRPQNFIDVIEQRLAGVPAHITNGEFLDAFYSSDLLQKQSFIDYEPPLVSNVSRHSYVLLAAIAEQLALDWSLTVPTWVNKDYYFLPVEEAITGGLNNSSEDLIAALQELSPPAFAKRNYLTTDSILTRA